MGFREFAKNVLARFPRVESVLRRSFFSLWFTRRLLGAYIFDARMAHRHLRWGRSPGAYWSLSSELFFYFHKLEKGLCLPADSRRFFGEDAVRQTCRLLKEWVANHHDLSSPVFKAAIEALRSWRMQFIDASLASEASISLVSEVDNLLYSFEVDKDFGTPVPHQPVELSAAANFDALMQRRRSVRDFECESIDFELVERAVGVAQLSPSACNRQPWHLHFYEDASAIRQLLLLQNGNSGFSHVIPLLAVVTADMNSFFDASERVEPALDGGLFLMSFLLALQSVGLSSCCLNWCVMPDIDRRAHVIGRIPENEKILTFLAIGRAREGAVVPLSARRSVSDVIRRHIA